MIADTLTILDKLGLKAADAQVFLACLKAPKGLFAQDIARMLRLGRSGVDNILVRLMARGFVKCVQSGRRKAYLALEPEAILARQNDVLAEFEAMVPFMRRLGDDGGMRVFEGVSGLKKARSEGLMALRMAPKGAELLGFVVAGVDLAPYEAMIAKTKGRARMLVAGAPQNQLEGQVLKIKRFDGAAFGFDACIEIYGGAMVVVYTQKDGVPSGFVGRSEQMAASFAGLFKLVWASLR